MALQKFKDKKSVSFFFSTVDHACVVQLKDELEILGHQVYFFEVDQNGLFSEADLIKKIKTEEIKGCETYLNFTYINNETGIVWPLELIETIKAETKAYVHVDAVQLIGKISNWKELSSGPDAFTFSGH